MPFQCLRLSRFAEALLRAQVTTQPNGGTNFPAPDLLGVWLVGRGFRHSYRMGGAATLTPTYIGRR